MIPLITSYAKDNTLKWLCHNVPLGQLHPIDVDSIKSAIDADFVTVLAILEDFQENSLIERLITSEEDNGAILLILKMKAHDLLQRGGFAIQDALTEANIQKILYELENLKKQLEPEKPDQLEIFNKITTIAASLATVLTAFPGKD